MKTTDAILLWMFIPDTCTALLDTKTDLTVLLQNQVQRTDVSEYQAAAELFPSLTSLSDPKSSRAALAQIEQAVISMHADRSQITPTVSGIVTSVVGLLDAQLLSMDSANNWDNAGAIYKAHRADQASLDTLAGAMDVAIDPGAETLANMGQVSQQHVENTETCQIESTNICNDVSVCTGVDQDATTLWAAKNTELTQKDAEIDAYWCLGEEEGSAHNLARTNALFREDTSIMFTTYNTLLGELEALDADKEATTRTCTTHTNAYSSHLLSCASSLANTISHQCSDYGSMGFYRQQYTNQRDAADQAYNTEEASTMLREGDRKIEWDVVSRVVCLLETLSGHTDDGDVSGADNLAVIEDCKSKVIDVSHLVIIYPGVPARLELPSLPVYPCDAEFLAGITPQPGCGDGTTVPVVHDADGNVVIGNMAVDAGTYGGSMSAECSCNFDTSTHASTQNVPHYLLVDLQLPLASFSTIGNSWQYSLDSHSYTGFMSTCYSLSPSRVLNFGDEQATTECHTYASQQAEAESLSGETIVHHWLTHGGFAYKNANGDVIGVMVWSPMTGTLGQLTSHILTFSSPSVADPATACGADGFRLCNAGTNTCPSGATGYCWVGTSAGTRDFIVEWKEDGADDTVMRYSLVV